MKKVISILASILCISTAWAQTTGADAIKRMNPYTCQLSHAVSADGKSITFSYYLNATADSIHVMVDKDGDRVFEDDEVAYTIKGSENATKLTRSDNQILSLTIPFTAFNAQIPRGKGYNWALRANRAAYSEATHAYPADWGRMVFNIPGGVAVNNNPENNYFGTIYVTESKTGNVGSNANGSQTNYHKDEGLYIYKSDLTQYRWTDTNGSGTCFTGGGETSNYPNITWSAEPNDDKAPDRVCVSAAGIPYINDNRAEIPSGNKEVVIWQVPTSVTLEDNKNRFTYAFKLDSLKKPDNYPLPRVSSMAVVGEGANQKLYVINAYRRVIDENNNYQYYPLLSRYSLSGQTSKHEKNWRLRDDYYGNHENALKIGNKKYDIANMRTMLVPGVHNDMWIAQRRETSIAGVPSLVHVKFSETNGNTLTCDYVIDLNHNSALLQRNPSNGGASPYGALALNTDGTMLAIASDGYINVMDVIYANNGTPTLTRNEDKSIWLGSGKSCNGLAFDKANNLYAVSQDTHQFYIYAMPEQASTTIPEQKANTINIPHVVTWHPYPSRPSSYVTDDAYNNWIKQTFKELIYPDYTIPTITRDGYIFDGWYYGDANSYDINDPYDPDTPKNGQLHIWARWVKATFEEGYITTTIEDGYSRQEVGKTINGNSALVETLLDSTSYLQNNNPIKVNRKLQGGMYNTFMLPFTLTQDLRENIIDSERQPLAEDAILTLRDVTSHTTNGETLYELGFAPVSASEVVPAYQPFLIKPTNDLTATMTFSGVGEVMQVNLSATEVDGVRFVPVFEPTTIGGEESNILLLVANNRLAKLSGSGEMLGLRGYFDVGDTFSSASYVMKIVDKAGVVTYVGDATAPQKGSVATKLLHNGQIYILRGNEVYTITGNRVR